MKFNALVQSKFEEYKAARGLTDKQLYVSIADTNARFRDGSDVFYLFTYYDYNGPTPDAVLNDFCKIYTDIEVKKKDDGGGYVFVIDKNKF